MRSLILIIFFAVVVADDYDENRFYRCPVPQEDRPSCAIIAPDPRPGQVSGIAAYEYFPTSPNRPSNWANLDCTTGRFSKFSGCSYCNNTCNGLEQTPIDVISSSAIPTRRVFAPFVRQSRRAYVQYKVVPDNFELSCIYPGYCGGVFFKQRVFFLDNIHAHEFSEHELNGQLYEMEAHLVHRSGNEVLVLAIFFKEGKANPDIQTFLDIASAKCFGAINLKRLTRRIFRPRNVVTYKGSLTTPPCTEGLTWVVSTKPITMSRAQITQFAILTAIGTEARPIQPLNGRKLTSYLL